MQGIKAFREFLIAISKYVSLLFQRRYTPSLFFFTISLLVFTFNNTHEQLWPDEALDMYLTDQPFSRMLSEIIHSGSITNPPFYFIIHKIIKLFFGGSVFISRFLSGVMGSFLVVALYEFVRKMFSKPVALISAAILMVNPVMIHFSQDIGLHIFVMILFCISQFSFFMAVKEGGTKFWVLHTLTGIAGIYTHYYFFFSIISNMIFYIVFLRLSETKFRLRSRSIILYIVSQGLILAAFVPWIPSFQRQIAYMSISPWTEPVDADIFLRIVSYFFTTKFSLDVNPLVPYQILSTIAFFLISLSLYQMVKTKQKGVELVFLFINTLAPVTILVIFSIVKYSIIKFDLLFLFFPLLVVILATGILSVGNKKAGILIVMFLLLANTPAIWSIYTTRFNGSISDTARFLKEVNQGKYPVLSFDKFCFTSLNYYLHEPSNLYYYSNDEPSVISGTGLASDRSINNRSFVQVLGSQSEFFVVLTPWTKDNPANYLQNIFTLYSADSSSEKSFVDKNSWFRTKVVTYKLNRLLADVQN